MVKESKKDIERKNIPKFETVDEERKYWEDRGPFAKGSRGKLFIKDSSQELCSSFLTIRLTGSELTELRDFASNQNMGPSTLVRLLIINLLKINGNKSKDQEDKTSMTMEQVFEKLDERMPNDLKERMGNLYKSSVIGDKEDKAPFLIMDPAHFGDFQTIIYKFYSYLIETINPNIKIVTPIDTKYNAVKSALEGSQNKVTSVKT